MVGRRGGPDFLDSEIARLGHLASASPSSIADAADEERGALRTLARAGRPGSPARSRSWYSAYGAHCCSTDRFHQIARSSPLAIPGP